MAAARMHGKWRQWRRGHLGDGRSNWMKQRRRCVPGQQGLDQAGMAQRCGHHGDIEQGGLCQLQARATAAALFAAVLFACGRMRGCGRGRLDRRRRVFAGVACAMRARAGSRWRGIYYHHCMRHHRGHRSRRHGVADPVQDQAKGKEQAQRGAGHGEKVTEFA